MEDARDSGRGVIGPGGTEGGEDGGKKVENNNVNVGGVERVGEFGRQKAEEQYEEMLTEGV